MTEMALGPKLLSDIELPHADLTEGRLAAAQHSAHIRRGAGQKEF
jgi:hypothetical protein